MLLLEEQIQNNVEKSAFETIEPEIAAAVQWMRLDVEIITAIRTPLNYFLTKELKNERRREQQSFRRS